MSICSYSQDRACDTVATFVCQYAYVTRRISTAVTRRRIVTTAFPDAGGFDVSCQDDSRFFSTSHCTTSQGFGKRCHDRDPLFF